MSEREVGKGTMRHKVRLCEADLERIAQVTGTAGWCACAVFEHDTQEAVIMAPDGNSMLRARWAEVHQ